MLNIRTHSFLSRHCCQFRSCFFGGLDPAACHLDLTTAQSWWQFQEVCVCVCMCPRLRFSHSKHSFRSIWLPNPPRNHHPFPNSTPVFLPFSSYPWQFVWVSADLAKWIFYNPSKHQTMHTHTQTPLAEQTTQRYYEYSKSHISFPVLDPHQWNLTLFLPPRKGRGKEEGREGE